MAANRIRGLVAAVSTAAAVLPSALAPLRFEVTPHGRFRDVPVMPFTYPDLPVLLSSGSGHVVAVRHHDGDGFSLLQEIGVGTAPRTVARFEGGLVGPSVGTDAHGRVVVVLRPCAAFREGDAPRTCSLAVFDLASGKRTMLPDSRGASLGDLDRGRAVLVNGTSVQVAGRGGGVRIAMPAKTAIATATQGDDASDPGIGSVDFKHGVVALNAIAQTEAGEDAMVLAARVGDPWTKLDLSRTGGGAQGPREFHGVRVTATGVEAYLDGASDLPSYAARWSLDGTVLRRVGAATFGGASLVQSAAFVGDDLITASSDSCTEHCGIVAAGPVSLG